MKKLSYFAKSNIFLFLSLVAVALDIFVSFPPLTSIWGLLLAFGYYYWGRNMEAHKNTMERLDEKYARLSNI